MAVGSTHGSYGSDLAVVADRVRWQRFCQRLRFEISCYGSREVTYRTSWEAQLCRHDDCNRALRNRARARLLHSKSSENVVVPNPSEL